MQHCYLSPATPSRLFDMESMANRRTLLKSLAAGAALPLAACAQPQAVASSWRRPEHFIDASAAEPLTKENEFLTLRQDFSVPPSFAQARSALPMPFWEGHDVAVDSYWKAWEMAFKNCHAVTRENGLVAPYLDAAFSNDLFMWDSVFMLMFGRYGERAFAFQRTLDNFYVKQHPNGFICRQIHESTGDDVFAQDNPSSTGPNLMPWSEWEYYLQFGDRARLAAVFSPLLAYYRWFRKNRTWQNGTYWSTGWGCGMDNQPRLSAGANHMFDHDHMSWIDTSCQAVFSARILMRMAAVLGRESDIADLKTETDALARFVNQHMWDERSGFYVDMRRDGSRSEVKSIAGYWALLGGIAPRDRRARMIAHLTNPETFGRPHPVPTLAADTPGYDPRGGYWRGGVWPSTNYMVLRALTEAGEDELAYRIGRRHHEMVTQVFKDTGTFFENYAPEQAAPGMPAKGDFVGWGGLGPISVFLEYVFGLRPDHLRRVLVWDVRLTEAHGVRNYPIGQDNVLDLAVATRASAAVAPVVTARARQPLRIELRWESGSRILDLPATSA